MDWSGIQTTDMVYGPLFKTPFEYQAKSRQYGCFLSLSYVLWCEYRTKNSPVF